MTDYRGVSKQAVVQSLQDAERFLRSLNLGPVITEKLDEWVSGDPFTKIQAATDRHEVAQAMRDTGSSKMFPRLGELLRYHALVDTENAGRKVYTDLCRWGGLSAATSTNYSPVDMAQDVYLITEYAKLAEGQLRVGPLAYGTRFCNVLDETRNRQPEVAAELEARVHSLVEKAGKGDDQGIADEVLENGLRLRNSVKQALFYITGLSQDVQFLNEPQVFTRYGIAVDSEKYATNEQAEEAKYDLVEEAHEVLGEYYETDEVQMAAVGRITDNGEKSGLVFVSTRRAAEALADYFNGRQQVIDQSGRQVQATVSKGKPAAPSAPQP